MCAPLPKFEASTTEICCTGYPLFQHVTEVVVPLSHSHSH